MYEYQGSAAAAVDANPAAFFPHYGNSFKQSLEGNFIIYALRSKTREDKGKNMLSCYTRVTPARDGLVAWRCCGLVRKQE